MSKRNFTKKILITIISLSLIGFSPVKAKTEIVETTNNTTSLSVELVSKSNNYLVVNILVDPNNTPINAVNIITNFATSSLEVIKTNTNQSACELFIIDEFSNQTGQINILCGKPNPGIKTKAIIQQIKFKIIKPGWTSITFDSNSMVLANDGLGTNVLNEINNKQILLN